MQTDIQTVAGEKIMHILIATLFGLGGILLIALKVMSAIFTVIEFFVSAVTFIISFGAILFVAIVALIIFGIYFGLSQIDSSLANAFLVTSFGGIAAFFIFGVTAYNKKEDGIKIMNRIRYTSDKFTDDELNKFINNNSVGEFERIGYMAAFADKYPPRKNFVDLSKS